ncbi:MAG: hypothetical protein K2Y22_01600 [Candidatus Obscuribacterales bacterium]|nr:hypothetical protein [Candidatus Obscuribacterales bacterium]
MQAVVVNGRIDEEGHVLLPVSLVASDGFEVEVEAHLSLEFDGALAVDEALAQELGWRCLGARRVVVGEQTHLMDHYIGMVALGSDLQNMVVLGGISKPALIGKRLLSGRKLSLDFVSGKVVLE